MLAVATLVVSLMMTSITFIALNGIQRDARMSDTRFARDLGLLLAANVTPLVAEANDRELAAVAERFWRSSRSLRYIFFADPDGVIYLGIPIGGSNGSSELLLSRRLELPADLQRRSQNPLIRQHLSPDGQVTDVFVPMVSEGRYLGVLALGINPNEAVLASAALTREVTVAVFISIWVLVILGAVFNALTITRPVKELKRFTRVTLKPGEKKTVTFELPISELAFWNIDMKKTVEPGDFLLWVAPDSQSGEEIAFEVIG